MLNKYNELKKDYEILCAQLEDPDYKPEHKTIMAFQRSAMAHLLECYEVRLNIDKIEYESWQHTNRNS